MQSSQKYVENYKAGKIFNLKFKQCVYRTKNTKGGRVVGLGTTDFIKAEYYKEHKISEYDFEAFGSSSSNVSHISNNSDSLLFGDMPGNGKTSSSSSALSSTSPISSGSGLGEFGVTSKVDNSKIADIYIDLDDDGINDLSYSDPVIVDSNTSPKSKKKNSSSSDDIIIDDGNTSPVVSDNNDDDSVIIKF